MQLIFDPAQFRQLRCPFYFYERKMKNGRYAVKKKKCTTSSLMTYFNQRTTEGVRSIDKLFGSSLDVEIEKYKRNYHRLNLKSGIDAYVERQLLRYYYKNLQKIFRALERTQSVYHRYRDASGRYRSEPAGFLPSVRPRLVFKLDKDRGKVKIETDFEIRDKIYDSSQIERNGPILRQGNMFYLLSKSDWNLLKKLDKEENISLKRFTDKYYEQLKPYSTDFSKIYDVEEFSVEAEMKIRISELSNNLLLFVPIWEYDGYDIEGEGDSFTVLEGMKQKVYLRDKQAEQESLDFMRGAHPKFKGQDQFYLTFAEASKNNWFFHFYYNQLKDNFTVEGMDMLQYFRPSQHSVESDFSIIGADGDVIIAEFKTYFGEELVNNKVLQSSLNSGNKFVLLKDNYLGILTEEWLDKYGIYARMGQFKGDEVRLAKWLFLSDSEEEFSDELVEVLPGDWLEKWKKWNSTEDELYALPETVQAELRNYQQKGYEWFNMMAEIGAGTLMADDMGLGKTLQALSSLTYWQEADPTAQTLIICPASLIYNWKSEIEKFTPHLKLYIYHGQDRDISDFMGSDAHFMITSYATVRNDVDKLMQMSWGTIVLDESHRIKNYKAKQTEAVLSLRGKRRIILNGTPIMNSIAELFPQFHFLLPQLFPSRNQFVKQFVNPIEKDNDEGRMDLLKRISDPFLLRRTKEKVAKDLPAKTETVLWCEMKDDQRQAYEDLKAMIKRNVLVDIKEKGLQKAKFGVLQGITKLRQLCSSPHLLQDEPDYRAASSIKIENLIDTLTSDLAESKAIIFTQFLGTLDALKEKMDEKGITYRSFSGKTSAEKRMKRVAEFQAEDSDIRVFILSLMAGNSGINLTNANYVFLVEPWWNKAIQQQAIDRVHRIGQDQNVFAYNMICRDTIEEKIRILQEKKQALSEEVISSDQGLLKQLTEEDIAFLFE